MSITTRKSEANPYRNVWNNLRDEEADLTNQTRNGTLFIPTQLELFYRHRSTAKYWLQKARKLGRTVEGHTAFQEALFHTKMAKSSLENHRKNLLLSKGVYIKKEEV